MHLAANTNKILPDHLSLNEKKALEILEKTAHHDREQYMYEAGLLWRDCDFQMPDNREMAEKRLKSTERTLSRDQTLPHKYYKTIDGCITKGYA